MPKPDAYLRLIEDAGLPRREWDTPQRRAEVHAGLCNGVLAGEDAKAYRDAWAIANTYGKDGSVIGIGDALFTHKWPDLQESDLEFLDSPVRLRAAIERLIFYALTTNHVLAFVAGRGADVAAEDIAAEIARTAPSSVVGDGWDAADCFHAVMGPLFSTFCIKYGESDDPGGRRTFAITPRGRAFLAKRSRA